MSAAHHSLVEDLQGVLTGTLFVALGVCLFASSGLMPGGVVGVALWLHYATGMDAAWVLPAVSMPFYALAVRRFGWGFALRSAACVLLLSAFVGLIPRLFVIGQVDPFFAAVAGGLLCGAGMLIVFRHDASFGGFNVVSLWLQERRGWRAGWVQMGLDAAVVLGGALALGDWRRIAPSAAALVAINFAIAVNHRPGRYRPA
jgi:uncharacterized membrane-anchored protein YitT (DUF2179 family)